GLHGLWAAGLHAAGLHAAATSAITAAAAIATAAIAAAGAGRFRRAFLGLVHRDLAAFDLAFVQGLNRLVGGLRRVHFHEAKAARTARFAVGNHLRRLH